LDDLDRNGNPVEYDDEEEGEDDEDDDEEFVRFIFSIERLKLF